MIDQNNLLNIGAIQLAKSLAEMVREDEVGKVLAFFSIISASEMIVRGCLIIQEKRNSSLEVSEIRNIELLYGSSGVSFSKIPKLIKTDLGNSISNKRPHSRMLQIRRDILVYNKIAPSDVLEKASLCFSFEMMEPLLLTFGKDTILMHLPETFDGFDEVIDRRITELQISQPPFN